MTSTHVSLGPLHLALVASRRDARATFRAWAQRGGRRRGIWMLARLRPLRVTVGRDVTTR